MRRAGQQFAARGEEQKEAVIYRASLGDGWALARDEHDFARLDRVQHLREFREEGLQEAQTVTVCHENDDRQTRNVGRG